MVHWEDSVHIADLVRQGCIDYMSGLKTVMMADDGLIPSVMMARRTRSIATHQQTGSREPRLPPSVEDTIAKIHSFDCEGHYIQGLSCKTGKAAGGRETRGGSRTGS